MRKWFFVLSALFLAAIVSAVYLYKIISQVGVDYVYLSNSDEVLSIELKKGDSANSLLRKLESKGVLRTQMKLAKAWLKLHPEYSAVKAGYYEFNSGSNLSHIFDTIAQGKVKQFSIALIEGLTLQQWLITLKSTNNIIYDIDDTDWLYEMVTGDNKNSTEKLTDNNTSEGFCVNQYKSLEGCLLANTYFFDQNTKASIIIQRAYNNMKVVIDAEWQNRYLDTAYTSPYEMLIMASIIEKETAVESERGLISGVFDNRLKRNMRLQTDPTVIYGIGDSFDGNLTRKHLRQKTPYNTYVIKGLPITPIAMAGPDSIRAAARPELTEAVYFVAKGDGTHQFSETLAQHNAAVREYQLKKGKQ